MAINNSVAVSLEEMKAQVKTIPITEYLRQIVVPALGSYYGSGEGYFAGGGQFERCPFHNEDTGSFKLYPETNTCYCFGCGVGGDVVALHKKFIENNTGNEPTYLEALTELYKWSVTQDLDTHYTTEQIGEQHKVEDWQAENKTRLLLLKAKLNDKFEAADIETYITLRHVEQFIDNTVFDINEVNAILDAIA